MCTGLVKDADDHERLINGPTGTLAFVTYISWHHRYKLDGSNRFVCLIIEVMGNKRQHALCKTAKEHYEIISGI